MGLVKKSDVKAKYNIGEVLGKGNFAEVRLATNKDTGEKVAIKIIEPKDEEDEMLVQKETEILGQLNHPNIIRLIDIYDKPGKMLSKRKIYIVMELVTGGELFDRIVSKQSFQESEARGVIRTVIETLEYMHGHGVAHRDLKPENILYATEADDSPIKVADFGLAKLYSPEGGDAALKTMCGTPGYVAPEVLRPKDKAKGYDPQVDMWSTGVILYILLCGFPPFYEDDQQKLFRKIVKGSYDFPSPEWDQVSAEAKDLISKCLQVDPEKRVTPAQALKHPWMLAASDALSHNIDTNNLKRYIRREKFKKVKDAILAVGRLQRLVDP